MSICLPACLTVGARGTVTSGGLCCVWIAGFGFVTFETEDPVHLLTGQRYVEMSGKQVR